jgi:beta-galactosidase beta subunit
MILDTLPQWRRYASLNPRFAKALAFLEQVTASVAGGQFAILFPDDAHAPYCAWAGPEPVVKVVVKVAVSQPARPG